MQLTIRNATLSDVDEILQFWAEAAEGTSHTDDPAGVRSLITRDGEALILAESDGTIVGSVIAGWDGWRCHLYRLAVAPDCRRRGIAQRLLERAEERFAALGGRRADGMVLDENTSAHGFWAAAGFTLDEPWSRWVKRL